MSGEQQTVDDNDFSTGDARASPYFLKEAGEFVKGG